MGQFVRNASGGLQILKPFCTLMLLLAIGSGSVMAQTKITGAIAGTVMDRSGAVVSGARVHLKDEATGGEKDASSDETGAFLFPDLSFGVYEISVTNSGFQTVVFRQVIVESSRTTDLLVRLQVGGVNETVQVEGITPVFETSSNLIASTINNTAVQNLPILNRTVTALARLTPGAQTPPPTADTHYNGLPGGAINPTLDGVYNASAGQKSGGASFFMSVRPRLGAIEEVSVETAGLEADAAGQGAVNLKFVTKRGSNQYHGSVFEQPRNEAFNANSFFNNARGITRSRQRQHDFGGNFSGPLLPFGKWKEKVFFFLNFETEYIPSSLRISNTVLTQEAQRGIFRYETEDGEERAANLLQIAGANGFQSTVDPLIASMLSRQNASFSRGRLSDSDLRTQAFDWIETTNVVNTYPTARVDYQITPNLSWMGSYNLYHQRGKGERLWPIPDQSRQFQSLISWWTASTGLNWTINSRTHNEFRFGILRRGDTIPNADPSTYAANGLINGAPFRLAELPLGLGSMTQDESPLTSRHKTLTLYDTLTMMRGGHTLKLGGSFRLTDWNESSFAGPSGILTVPQYTLGVAAGDPVTSIFDSSTLPDILDEDLENAASLYAYLTGRVARVQIDRVVDPKTFQYSAAAERKNWTSIKMGGLYLQDSWRVKPGFTLNYGLRWEMTGDMYNVPGVVVFPDPQNLLGPSTALFQPGGLGGVANPVLRPGKHAYNADLINPAPNFGFSWNPRFDRGILNRIFGSGQKTVVRGGYGINYYDEGTMMFSSNLGNNPGQTQTLDLQPGFSGFEPGDLTLQSALPAFSAFPLEYKNVFNQSDFTFSRGFAGMDRNLRTPYVQQWNFGIQREVMRNTVVEARYLGNRSVHGWRTFNLNEVNIFENGFLTEFKNAQRNLEISQAAGVANFANRGLPGQVALPIFETAFGARGSQGALRTTAGFTNGTFLTSLRQGTAGALAGALAGNSNYLCRLVGSNLSPCSALGFNAAGPYPINFFQVNPYAAGQRLAFVDDNANSSYHAFQLQVRRRLPQGLSATLNYTYSKARSDVWADSPTMEQNFYTLRNPRMDRGPSPHDLRHVLQGYFTYDLPLGRGRAISFHNGVLNGILGGWTLGGILTAQSGSVFRLTSGRQTVNGQDGGVILAGGLTRKELQKLVNINSGPGLNRYYLDPKLIGSDGRANSQYLKVPTEPGQFGEIVYLYGKNNFNLDASLVKNFQITERINFNLWLGASNVLNHPIWTGPIFLSNVNIQSTTFAQSTGPSNSPRLMQIRGTLNF
jgi:hypothetical protein